jgi:uncharacterized protein
MKITSNKITDNLYYITDTKDELLYSPLDRKVIKIEGLHVDNLKNKEYTKKIINYVKTQGLRPFKKINLKKPDFKFTKAGIFLTSDCDLRCIYCYARAGTKQIYLNFEPIKEVVDYIFNNGKRTKSNVSFTFHGGGEPTKNMEVLKEAVRYIRLKSKLTNIKSQIYISTGGFINKEKAEWIAKNLDFVQLSMDGMSKAQDKNRPTFKGDKSSNLVSQTLKILNKNNSNYCVRLTVTKFNLKDLPDHIKYIARISQNRKIHIEPVNCSCSHGDGENYSVEPDLFTKNVFKAIKSVKSKVIMTILNAGDIKTTFCHGLGMMFNLTPEGYITSCYEVTLKSDPRSEFLFFGKYDKTNKKIVIDKSKLKILKKRDINTIKGCKDCFVRYNCGGGCVAISMSNTNPKDGFYNNRCGLNCIIYRKIIFNSLCNIIKDSSENSTSNIIKNEKNKHIGIKSKIK